MDQNLVAIKRLNTQFGQGNVEFWREITMLSRYTHENLISLMGFCDEGGEKILVYEYAYHGSLDRHLSSPLLTWTQRIKICLDAARGLSFLHDGDGIQQRVLHRDVKSSNILLDENWAAKVSDMGLSKIGPSHQLHTAIVTNVVGTIGYLDPLYLETGILSKESDVYSFGVMLFEVLCGKLCYKEYKGQCQVLVRSWKQSYKENHLSDIIFQDLAQQINPDALEIFSHIAFQCLQKSRDKRPTMQYVVEYLESALESHDPIQGKEWLIYEEIARTAVPPLEYRSKGELRKLLSVGVFLNNGRTWFSLDNNGKHCEMISIEERHSHNSRFDYKKAGRSLRTLIRAQFLSPLITYTTNLVFKGSHLFEDIIDISSNFNYTLLWGIGNTGFLISLGNTKYLRPHLASKREDGMMMVELCQFTTDVGETVNLDIEFQLGFPSSWEIVLEGIEFRPLEKVEHKMLKHEKVDTPYSFNSHTYWDQILPNDYQEILKWSDVCIQWTTKKELYIELCKGFLMNNGQEWFFLNKNGKKCSMLSAKACIKSIFTDTVDEETSRFGKKALRCTVCYMLAWDIKIVWEIRSQVLSPETTYATYLVYRLALKSSYMTPVRVTDKHLSPDDLNVNDWDIYLNSPWVGEDTHNQLNSSKLPQERSDGWMEVQIWEFQTVTTTSIIPISLQLKSDPANSLLLRFLDVDNSVLVLGIEFRPK